MFSVSVRASWASFEPECAGSAWFQTRKSPIVFMGSDDLFDGAGPLCLIKDNEKSVYISVRHENCFDPFDRINQQKGYAMNGAGKGGRVDAKARVEWCC